MKKIFFIALFLFALEVNAQIENVKLNNNSIDFVFILLVCSTILALTGIIIAFVFIRKLEKASAWNKVARNLTKEPNLKKALDLMKSFPIDDFSIITGEIICYIKDNVYDYPSLKSFRETINDCGLSTEMKQAVRGMFIKYLGVSLHLRSLPKLYAQCITAQLEGEKSAEEEKQFILEAINMACIDNEAFLEALSNEACMATSREFRLAIEEEIEKIKNQRV